MSYDLTMIEVREGETVEAAHERSAEPARPTAEGEQLRRDTVAALLAHNPELDVFETASLTELTSLDGSKPVQVTVYGDQASITIPYSHSGDAARVSMDAVWQLVEIIHRRTGWILYDEQLGRQIDVAAGPQLLVGGYEDGTAAVSEIVATGANDDEDQAPKPRRRRRFWPFS